MCEVRDAITATFEDFEFIVDSFDEATGMAADEIIGDFLEMSVERSEEAIKTGKLAVGDTLHPPPKFALALPF